MDEVVPRVLQFDRFVLDLARGCLRLDDRELELRPKAFKVLCHLAERAGHLVAKEELYKAVWNDIAVSDDSLVQCIRQLRHTLGDDTPLVLHMNGQERSYATLTALEHDALNARIWGGLHFRDAMDDGYYLGHTVADEVIAELH